MAAKLENSEAQKFFGRSPGVVAKALRNKVMIINGRTVVIHEAVARNKQHCERFRNRPLFREEDPALVYSGNFMGHQLLFLLTTPGTCVQINKIELGGQVINGPGRVGEALGLTKDQEGTRTFDGTVCTIKWKGYGKRKKRKKGKKKE